MQFPKEYFHDEVRDGFYINGLMKRAWAAQLEVLEEVAKICELYNIRWYADCGTLLGAVRHGGYVPWDDDLDICMLRDDYERFNQIAREELPTGYKVMDYRSDEDYWELLTRVTNGDRINVDQAHLEKYHGFPFVAGIDIFPLDFVAPDAEEEEARRSLASIVQAAANRKDLEDNPSEETLKLLHQVQEMTGVQLNDKSSLKLQLYDLTVSIFSLYTRYEAKEVVLMPYWITHHDHKYSLEWFQKTLRMPFEAAMLSVPINYNSVLCTEYSVLYTRLFHGGGVHDYPFYKGQEAQLTQLWGERISVVYKFKKEDLIKPVRSIQQKVGVQAKEFANRLQEIHKKIYAFMQEQNDAQITDLLIQCQNEAIRIGILIEESKGEGFVTVKYLEEYCELVYRIYQEILVEKEIHVEWICEKLEQQINIILDSIENDLKKRKEIVFLPWKASSWDSLESVWRAADEDPDCDAYVMPIPYYDKNLDGSFGELHYEGNLYPPDVPIFDINQYNFAERQPDMIFINNPYDEYNYTTSVYPFFYAKNLKRYTDKLVYVPYFKTDEISMDDAKAMQTLQYFVTMPGVVHADKVIVQSEQMRRRYVETLAKHCGEDTREIWEEKILGWGSPISDKVAGAAKESVSIPEDWRKRMIKADGSYKKVILYSTSISLLLEKEEEVLGKMQEVFATFQKYQDEVTLIWKPNFVIKECESIMKPLLWQKYQALIKQYKKDGWGIYDDTIEWEQVLAISDAYYGDSSSVAAKCRRKGIPVMFQSI